MLRHKVVILVILKLCLCLVNSAVIFDKIGNKSDSTYRLSNESIPINYFIHLETDIHSGNNFIYSGYVIIDIKIVRDTKVLRLHERQINVGSVELSDSADKEISIAQFVSISEYDFLDIELRNELTASDDIFKLKISFTASLREFAEGFYRSYYRDEDKIQHWIGATHFEPSNARYAFPCYDEPGLKSTFELEIKHHMSYMSISNYKGNRIINDVDDYVITKFDKTVKMSIYSLVFVVSDYIASEDQSSIPIQNLYTRPNASNQTKFGLEEGVKIIEVLQEYVGFDYSLEKLDQVSMQNLHTDTTQGWGLVIYNEHLLLLTEETASLNQKLDIITTISHQYANQFFGNLVSPKWWDSIWLNEGFATLMEYYIPHLLYPTERYMDLFVINRLQYAMAVDGLVTDRPMTHYAESPSDINGLFDTIAYHKSASVLRMIQNILSEETFKRGLKFYLERHELDVVVPEDLFRAFIEAENSDLTVSPDYDLTDILEIWTLNKGYPLLTVTRSEDDGMITLTQHQFLYVNDGVPLDQLWIIPFSYFTNSNTIEDSTSTMWMPNQVDFDLPISLAESDWIIFNTQQTGYYRVNYDINNWELLINYLTTVSDAFEKIGPINRAQLIDDSFNLARAGILPYEIPLKLVQYLKNEFDYIPWAAAYANLDHFHLLLKSNVHKYFAQFINELTKSTLERIGYERKADDSNFDILLRSLIIDWRCKLGDTECLEFVENERRIYFNSAEIDHNLKEQILCHGLDEIGWSEVMFRILFSDIENNWAERILLYNSVGCVNTQIFLSFNLAATVLVNSNLTSTDRYHIFMSVLSKNDHGLELTIPFVNLNYVAIEGLYGGNKIINKMVLAMASYVRTATEATMFGTYVLDRLINIIDESTIVSSGNIISERILWQDGYAEKIKNFLWEYYEVQDDEDGNAGENDNGGGGASTIIIPICLLTILQFIILTFNQ